MVAPKFSSDPKVGTSLGFLAGYLFKLDPGSTSSMAGAMGTYSNTDSYLATAFLRSYWDKDRKRLTAAIGGGRIRNDYSDFLGSGLPASTTDEMKLAYARYLQAVRSDWFVGVQGVYTNYLAVGDDFRTDEVLKALGLNGVDSGALGLVLMYDDRNNQNDPSAGKLLDINNFAYREAFGGEENFDTLNLDFTHYIAHAKGAVFAYHIAGRWTHDAPNSGYSSVHLRGYTRGQYLAPHSVSLEVEERLPLYERFGVNVFAGVACLYGDGEDCGERDNLYPSAGVGMSYLLKPSEQMVVTLDYAKGEGENSGFYVRFGRAF
ncbi:MULTISPECIES: BamA/TamA family outer membrane protein [Marinobacter]|uniref:BamA/TamA family outer membrane protein n=1 Tax=Marinobacter TaxID=2742 RepID=UPI000DAE18D9|nr:MULTISPECIES: BamA/TamA family outer membrane protein [Marinobacter]